MFNNSGVFFRLLLLIGVLSCSVLNSCKQQQQEMADHPQLVDSILDDTNELLNGGEIKKAETYLDSAFGTIARPGRIDIWKKYDHRVTFYLNYENNLEKARAYADSMLLILKGKSQKHRQEFAKSIFSNSEVLLAEKKYNEAFRGFYRGKTFAKQYLDSCDYQEFTYKLGLVKYTQGKYLEAAPFFKQAFAEGGGCKVRDGFGRSFIARQRTLNTIALCFEQAGNLDSAVYYYRQALAFIDLFSPKYPERKQFIQVAKGVVLGNLGGVLAALNQDALAEESLIESIRINNQPLYDVRDAQTAKIKLAKLYLKTRRFKESEKLLNDLQVYLSVEQNINTPIGEGLRLKWYKLKWEYYEQTGRIPAAYLAVVRFHTYRDSLNKVNAGLKDIDLDHVFRDSEQRYKLALLDKSNQLKQGYLFGAALIALLALTVLVVVWFNLKNSRRLNMKMASQNEDLQLALGSLEQSQEENTRIMRIVAHDLRSPMAATVSIVHIVLENDQLQPEDRELLELLKTSSVQSLEMTTDLLKMNTTAEGLKKEPVEMHMLLQYCVDLLKFKANDKKQKIVLQPKEIVVNVSREKIWRVFSNLIVNAIKFSPEGSSILVTIVVLEDVVQIVIQDHGIGIPENLKDRIFNLFTDSGRTGTAGEQSFGLGLAICKRIVDAHQGRIWFDSIPGEGTTFYVELPV